VPNDGTCDYSGACTPASTAFLVLAVVAGVVVGLIVIVLATQMVRIVHEYERGVVYRFGRVKRLEQRPGLCWLIPFVDRLTKVVVAVEALSLESQRVITKDNVSLRIDAVIYFRVLDAIAAEVKVDDYEEAIQLRGQSALRQVIGATDLAKVLGHSEDVADAIRGRLADVSTDWGVDIESIELKDVSLPEGMQRAMAAAAEAEREAAAKVAAAKGESESAELLREAADKLGPAGLRLRELETIRAIGTEHNTVIVMDSASGATAAAATAGQIAGHNSQ